MEAFSTNTQTLSVGISAISSNRLFPPRRHLFVSSIHVCSLSKRHYIIYAHFPKKQNENNTENDVVNGNENDIINTTTIPKQSSVLPVHHSIEDILFECNKSYQTTKYQRPFGRIINAGTGNHSLFWIVMTWVRRNTPPSPPIKQLDGTCWRRRNVLGYYRTDMSFWRLE